MECHARLRKGRKGARDRRGDVTEGRDKVPGRGGARLWLMDWIGLDWIGLDWIGLDWIGLDRIGLDWIGLD